MEGIFGIVFFTILDTLFVWWTFLYFEDLGSYFLLFIGCIALFTYGIYENAKKLK